MDYRRKVQEALKVRCVYLKTKRAWLGLPGPQDVENDLDTAVWWCERTAEKLGPDGHAAAPRACGAAGRACYEAPRRPAP